MFGCSDVQEDSKQLTPRDWIFPSFVLPAMHRPGAAHIFALALFCSASRASLHRFPCALRIVPLARRAMSTARAATPTADSGHPSKKARLQSPARDPVVIDAEDTSPDRDVVMDALDAAGAPAIATGESSGPEAAGTSSASAASAKQPKKKGRRQKHHSLPEPCSNEDVVLHDVSNVLGKEAVDRAVAEGSEWASPFETKEEVEVEVKVVASNGEGLGIVEGTKPWAVMVPFALPGERVRARVYRSARLHSFADLLGVERKNEEWRNDDLVQCRYFGKCAGCQYQMLSYDKQLQLKRDVVVKAYQNFSNLPPSDLPPIQDTLGSPLQYGYRTKITPHFDAAPKKLQGKGKGEAEGVQPDWLKIGFNKIGTRHVMDIEECPIATPVINATLGPTRQEIIKKAYAYKKGVSLLFRDSLKLPATSTPPSTSGPTADEQGALAAPPISDADEHICVTDHRGTVRERVGSTLFQYTAGSFFQNNNSVLVPLTSYVRSAIFPSTLTPEARPTHLVDAYCGAGLFSLMLSPEFEVVAGVELSTESIAAATRNAELNRDRIPEGRCTFRAGDAASIFASVSDFPRARTALVIDPPRKGCDANFIDQLVEFKCQTVVYVSCNVHTQARDVGMILERMKEKEEGRWRYKVESLRGFDLFPQTAHVESVAVLRLEEVEAS